MNLNGETLIPLASIFEKLSKTHPDSATIIMNRSEEIAEERRTEERRRTGTFKGRLKRIWQRIEDGMIAHPGPYGFAPLNHDPHRLYSVIMAERSAIAMRNDMAHVGNDMRRAIAEHMAKNSLTINLTAEEAASLEMVKILPLTVSGP